jgi:hypothetical protein
MRAISTRSAKKLGYHQSGPGRVRIKSSLPQTFNLLRKLQRVPHILNAQVWASNNALQRRWPLPSMRFPRDEAPAPRRSPTDASRGFHCA